MHTPLTEEQQELVSSKDELIEQKAALLKEYKGYEKDLEFAFDTFEEDLIKSKREKLAAQVKALGAQIREIEALEEQA